MSESATLYLLRHGTPEIEGRLLGRTDCEVTDAGIAACIAQAGKLDISRIISSDLRRAARCAEAIAGERPLRHMHDSRWRELDFGEWDGSATNAIDPAALGSFWADPDKAPPPGGERWSSLKGRVERAIADLQPVPTLIVSHGGAIRAAISVLCGFEQQQCWAFDLPYASLTTIRWWVDEPRRGQITALRP